MNLPRRSAIRTDENGRLRPRVFHFVLTSENESTAPIGLCLRPTGSRLRRVGISFAEESPESGPWEPLSRRTRRAPDANDDAHEESVRLARPRPDPPPRGVRPRIRAADANPERG